MVKAWWILLRGSNLIFICAIPVLLHFFFLKPSFDIALSDFQIWILAMSIALIAAAGYIINDVYDQHADRINKPAKVVVGKFISESKALKAFGFCAFMGLGLGFVLAVQIDQWNYAYVHAISLVILWLYAIDFKGRVLIGNLLISILASLNILIVVLFDLLPTLDIEGYNPYQFLAFDVLKVLAGFAFVSTFVREMIKDLEDQEGDRKAGYKTIGTQWPLARARAIILLISLTELAGLIWLNFVFQDSIEIMLWISVILIGSLAFAIFSALKGNTRKNYRLASLSMKVHMMLGLISPIVLTIF